MELYTRIGGIGGSSILELFKYPLRFEVSLVLLPLSASVFSPPLARYRFLYLICERVCIACSTVACALKPRYQIKRMSIITAFWAMGAQCYGILLEGSRRKEPAPLEPAHTG